MTLKEAQRKWDDAIEMRCRHKPYAMSEEILIASAERNSTKVLFMLIGKTSSRIIYSRMAAKEEARQLSLVPGTKVRMLGIEAEIENLKDTIFTVTHGPKYQCGSWVVWLDKYCGAYLCKYLEKLDILEKEKVQ
jgi:uncharacterized DUF497 family protein